MGWENLVQELNERHQISLNATDISRTEALVNALVLTWFVILVLLCIR